MGELGGMSTGFTHTQESEFCQEDFEAQQLSYPPCGSGSSYPGSGSSYPSPPDMSQGWSDVAAGHFAYDGSHQIVQKEIPELIITEEPIPKIRFRYQSERGSHGSMAGRSSSTTHKTWPSVKLINYSNEARTQVKVRASLFTEDCQKLHVHKLLGRKDCNKETGDCILLLNADMTCSFPSLGVLFTEKKRVHEVLYNRKIEELRRKVVPEETLKQIAEEAKLEAKEMKLNSIRIRFQALDGKTLQPITPPVFSEPVHNLKSPESGELKITRLSRFSSSSEGGEEVFLLCEKVNKKDIKVRFFQVNEQNQEVWSDFGKFADSDVHHQVAIVFKTPPYSDCSINKPVKVGVQLYRQNDGEMSESLEFTYRPRDRDPDNLGVKRKRPNGPDDDFKDYEGEEHQGPYVNPQGQFPHQPHTSSWTDSSHHNDYPMMTGSHNYQGGNQLANFVDQFAEGLQMASSSSNSSQDSFVSAPSSISASVSSGSATSDLPPASLAPAQIATSLCSLEVSKGGKATTKILDPSVSPSTFLQEDRTASLQEHRIESLFPDNLPPLDEATEMDSMVAQLILPISRPVASSSKDTEINFVRGEMDESMSTFQYFGPDSKFLKKPGFNLAPTEQKQLVEQEHQMEQKVLVEKKQLGEQKQHSKPSSQSSALYKPTTVPAQKDSSPTRVTWTKQIPSRFGHYLRRFTSTGNVRALLYPLAPFLASQNDEGDNAVHLAVIHQPKNTWLFKHLMPVVSSLMPHSLINDTNNIYQTPLHLAVSVGETNVVQLLLLSGADPNCQDRRGNTPLQIAVLTNEKDCLAILLNKGLYNIRCKGQPLPNPDILNYDGNSALHLAIKYGSKKSVSLLVDARADLNIRDGTSGRTPLHLAVEMQSPLIEFLLKQEPIEVNCQDYAGNTPLHLACSYEYLDLALLLMKANANPLIYNFIPNEDSDLEAEEEEDFAGTTPRDLAQRHSQLLSILGGTVSKDVEKTLHESRRMSIEERDRKVLPFPLEAISRAQGDPSSTFSTPSVSSPTQKDVSSLDSNILSADLGYESKEGPLSSESLSQQTEEYDAKSTCSKEEEVSPEVMKGLCQMLDPPSRDWEKLAGLLFEEPDILERIKTLEKSPTTTIIKKLKEMFEIYTMPDCQRPSRAGNTSSHLNTKVKPRVSASVPGLGADVADAVGRVVRIPLKTSKYEGPFDLKSALEAAGLTEAATYVGSSEKILNVRVT